MVEFVTANGQKNIANRGGKFCSLLANNFFFLKKHVTFTERCPYRGHLLVLSMVKIIIVHLTFSPRYKLAFYQPLMKEQKL